jgi:pimeloyl-ACP methyl ester carboxylesterase
VSFAWQTQRLWQDRIETRVEVGGSGPPLVYLHGPWGLAGDRDFLDRLSAAHRVFAPWHPGTSPGDPEAIHRLDDWLDLVVYHGELFDRLGLAAPALVGHSCGGMLAAELAAAMPNRAGRLALIAPLGLWRDDKPVRNWMILPEAERAAFLFADPAGPAAARFFAVPNEPAARVEAQAAFTWGAGLHRQIPMADPGQGPRQAEPPHRRPHPAAVGRCRPHRRPRLCRRFCRPDRRRPHRGDRRRRPPAAGRAA